MSSDTPKGEIILFQSNDGQTKIQVRFEDKSVWLTQAAIAELFQTTPQNITLHLKSIFEEGELVEEATCKEYLQVRQEGKRQINRQLKHYSLEAILAVGYRVRSARGTQFRQWATAQLQELLVKGFVMDDDRLKDGKSIGQDYFDELLLRIRDIRASERRFYQKITDIYATSMDYDTKITPLDKLLLKIGIVSKPTTELSFWKRLTIFTIFFSLMYPIIFVMVVVCVLEPMFPGIIGITNLSFNEKLDMIKELIFSWVCIQVGFVLSIFHSRGYYFLEHKIKVNLVSLMDKSKQK